LALGRKDIEMATAPTEQQTALAIKILKHVSDKGFDIKAVTKETRAKTKQDKDKQWFLLPAFVVDNRYYCGWDVYYGHDIVVDLLATKAYISTRGIFEKDFVFISDYHGFSDGAFYYRSTNE